MITLEEKVIKLYEQVACGIITPNQARLRFLKIIDKTAEKCYQLGYNQGIKK